MKTYVITLSKVFLAGHPNAGQPTNFKEQFLAGKKIHTIRASNHWKKVVTEVNMGIAFLSVREWSGKPYNSHQVEIAKIYNLGWQEISLDVDEGGFQSFVYGRTPSIKTIADNDGLSLTDFYSWFKMPKPFTGGIIHFTEFRY